MVSNTQSRKTFLVNAVGFLKQYGFDGLDFDWEYPTQRGGKPQDQVRDENKYSINGPMVHKNHMSIETTEENTVEPRFYAPAIYVFPQFAPFSSSPDDLGISTMLSLPRFYVYEISNDPLFTPGRQREHGG